jgi:hypothetical protein
MKIEAGLVAPSRLEEITMTREKKFARELADMIAARMKIEAGLVSVHKDAAYGWAVNVFTGPSRVCFGDQHLAEQIAAELRERYDLAE